MRFEISEPRRSALARVCQHDWAGSMQLT